MNASLPVLPQIRGSTAEFSGPDQEFPVLQGDTVSREGFAPVLKQAHAALAAEYAAMRPGSANADDLLRQVQSLPQAGKLLPLLEQLLRAANSQGMETRQMVQRLAEEIQQFAADDADPSAGVSLESTLRQLLDDIPTMSASAARILPMESGGQGKPVMAEMVGERSNRQSPAPLMPRQPIVTEVAEKPPVAAVVRSESGSNNPIRVLEQLQPRQPEVIQPQSRQLETLQVESANLMATLKRMTLGGKSLTAAQPSQAEPATVALPAATAPVSTPSTSVSPTLSMSTPLAQGDWDQALGERIQWMLTRQIKGAQIRLNPAQLGPLEVRLQVHNDQASIQFSSGHGVVREALEAALPRLREMFDASGVELLDVDVSGQSFAGGQRPGDDRDTAAGGIPTIVADSEVEPVLETSLSSLLENGRLDLFA